MSKIKYPVILALLGLLVTGCEELKTSTEITSNNNSSSVTLSSIASTSNNFISSSTSSSNISSSTSEVLEEKILVISSDNFNKIENIELIDVVENVDYPEEFTFNSNGIMKSNNYLGIKEIEIHAYSTYENLKVYNNYSGNGNALVAQKEEGTNEATYTYTFNNENEFYIVNSSTTHRTHVYSISITYLNINTTNNENSKEDDDSSDSSNLDSTHYTGTYYKNIDTSLSGSSLKGELRELITDTHDNPTSYDELKTAIPKADASINNPSKIVLIYSRTEINGSWDGAATWNREHVWPKANGWFKDSGAGSDLHHIRPEDPDVNNKRGNIKFGTGSSYFEPVDEAKGDVARIIFYLLTRYSQSDSYGVTKVAQSMTLLLEWNELDPVDKLEIQRNNVAENIQGNRNPFIDYPEFANTIWE